MIKPEESISSEAISRKKNITIRDIAEQAGVGTTSVSKFFSGKGYLGSANRKKIADVVRKTGFRINQQARQLKSGSSRQVAVIMPSQSGSAFFPRHFFIAEKLTYILNQCFNRGYEILLLGAGQGKGADWESLIHDHSFGGVIFIEKPPAEVLTIVNNLKLPYIMSNFACTAGGPDIDHRRYNAVVTDYNRLIIDLCLHAKKKKFHAVALNGFEFRSSRYHRILADSCRKMNLSDRSEELSTFIQALHEGDNPGNNFSDTLCASVRLMDTLALHTWFFKNKKERNTGLVAMDYYPEYKNFFPSITHFRQNIQEIGRQTSDRLIDMVVSSRNNCGTTLIPAELVEAQT